MKSTYLEFEKPIESLEAKIISLQKANEEHPTLDIKKELEQLEKKSIQSLHDIYDNLTPWQISQVARHPQRPYTLDYISNMFTDFHELHGDRSYSDDPAIIGGLATFEGQSIMVIGHQKGRDTKDRQFRNFGMPRPEGYRKALRLFKLAEKFSIPIVTFIDTPGAYPGIGAEERGQSEAIAKNLYVMSELKTPIIGIVIGEGGSGGALALGVVDSLLMMQFSTYSVISPEGCASILWKKAEMAEVAAENLGITADVLKRLGLTDYIIPEPLGGAHRNLKEAIKNVESILKKELMKFRNESIDSLLENRYLRLMNLASLRRLKNKSDVIFSEVVSSFNDFFQDQKKSVDLTVGLSGGVDSMVLLNVLYQLKTKLNLKLSAIHIHHGLSKNADHWSKVCLGECKRLDIDFYQKKINIDNSEGLGIEAAARKARYQILHQQANEVLVTAHHQNDQAETLMLQLLRGSGLKGLASMPLFDKERRLWRPFLKLSKEIIEEYAKNNDIRFIEDESNKNTEFDRNFLRLEIFPKLINRFPQTIKSLGRSADLVAEGLNLNKAIATEDAKNYFSEDFNKLNTKIFSTLPRDRVINLIRWWLDKNQQ